VRSLKAKTPISATGPMDLRWHIWAVWLALAALTLSATRADPDLWGHLRFGLDWLQTRRLPAIDPYSFTQDRPWINHEWLSEAMMALAYHTAGTAGLVVLKMAVMGCALAVLVWRLRGSSPIVAASVAAIAIVAALPLSGTLRPQIWSALGLALLMTLLDGAREPGQARAGAAAMLFAVWANMHGGWISGAIVLVAHAAVRIARVPRHAFGWLLLTASALAGTLLNPYGIGLWKFLATTVRASRPDITEWQPFTLHEPLIMWVSVVAPLAIALALARRRDTRPPVEVWVVLLLLIAAGLRVSRVAPLMAPAALVLLAPSIRNAWGHAAHIRGISTAGAVVFAAPVALAILAASAPVARSLRCIPMSDSWAPDREAAAALRNVSGRVWTTFDWGEFAIWHFGPRLRVSIDGRRETIYSDDVIQWHRAFDRGDPGAFARFSAIAPEFVWLRSSNITARAWLVTHGYRIDKQTNASFVAVRVDLPALDASTQSRPVCFP
jgi:FtsH-binding integral membrane protein